jgi:hypothetical protein
MEPYEGIAHVLGHSAMYWYQATQALGRISIVGSTVKDPSAFPLHVVADEKHSWWLGRRIYIAVTAAKECFLGVSMATDAGAAALTQAYGVFQCTKSFMISTLRAVIQVAKSSIVHTCLENFKRKKQF